MNKKILLLLLTLGLLACNNEHHDHGPDANHGHDDAITSQLDDHGHEHADDEAAHTHAPETEAFYGEEASDKSLAPSQLAPATHHDHSHNEAEHDHSH